MSLVDSLLETHCFSTLEDNFGVQVAIQRGPRKNPASGVGIDATWEQITYQAIDNEGMTTTIDARAYIFKKENYVIQGKVVEPDVGDRILEPDPITGELLVFEVMPIASQAAVIELPGGYRWKCHVKRVGDC